MYVYALFLAFAGMIAGILLALCSKKAVGVTYGRLV